MVDWCRMVSYPRNVPKTSCCLYRSVHGRLKTRITVGCGTRVFCATNNQKAEIISFKCPYSAFIWKYYRLNSSWHKVTLWAYWCDSIFTRKFSKTASRLMKITLGTTIWSLWRGMQGSLNQNHVSSYDSRNWSHGQTNRFAMYNFEA